MSNILVHYFSGTGNSRLAAHLMANVFQNHGNTVTLRSIEEGFCRDANTADIHAFFFPVYATAIPHIMARYMRHMPKGSGTRAVVLSSNGRVSTRWRDGHQGWSLHQARLLLTSRGYDVFFSDTFDMPHNVTAFGPPRNDAANRIIIDKASAKITAAAGRIAHGERYHRRLFFLNFLWSVPFGCLYSWIGRRAIGKLITADPSCSSCGHCINECPAHNIRKRGGRLWFGWRCEGCLRCVNRCTRNTIQLSTVRLIAMASVSLWYPLTLFGIILPAWLTRAGIGIVQEATSILCAFILYYLADWLLFGLGFVPGLNHMLSWGHTRLFGRYHADRPANETEDPSSTILAIPK